MMQTLVRHVFASTILIAATQLIAQAPARAVVPGITVLVRDSLHLLAGKRVGLITNHTGRDAAGVSSIDLLAKAPGVRLVALFGPEHGLRGVAQAGEKVASSVDSATGVPIYSLYGATRVPTPEMLRLVDILVYDIQDVGSRTYTYAWTMALSAEAAGRAGIPFIVCDRPVPVRGDIVQGGVLDTSYRSFVGQYPVALRYGLTAGELLRHLVRTGQVAANITVVPMEGWRRTMWYDETGLPWIVPSPNLRTLDAAILYTGTVFVEGTNMSEGRGTEAPFQLVGAPWLTDAPDIVRELSASPAMTGVRLSAVTRTIAVGQKHAGLTIPMIQITVVDRNALDPVRVGMVLLSVIRRHHPTDLILRNRFMDQLAGDSSLRLALEGNSMQRMLAAHGAWRASARRFAAQTRVDQLYR